MLVETKNFASPRGLWAGFNLPGEDTGGDLGEIGFDGGGDEIIQVVKGRDSHFAGAQRAGVDAAGEFTIHEGLRCQHHTEVITLFDAGEEDIRKLGGGEVQSVSTPMR